MIVLAVVEKNKLKGSKVKAERPVSERGRKCWAH